MDTLIAHLTSQFQLPLQNPVLIFSLILFIILLAPLALTRLRVPGIIGLIVSGIVIGPAGFNILEDSLFVDVFSTIGLLYIMFIAGLELDLNEFKMHKYKSLMFGIYTFCIPLSIGFPICHYLLDFDFYASLLVASIFATHTLVAYPIVSKLGITKDLAVAVTVGGTIFTDAAVLIVLAIILGADEGGLTVDFWIHLGTSIFIFTLFAFMVIPRIAQWFFNNLESESYSHYIFVLAMVFLTAFLSEIAGLEAIIGAFVAGLALNKLIPSSSALMNRIEFIGNALFIPFFLISVGMVVDIKVILNSPSTLVIAAILTAVAMVGKYTAALATRFSFRMSSDQGNLIFGLSSSHAAATLAVVLVGYREGIVGDIVLNAIVIIILVSCVIASFATEKAAKNIVQASDDKEDLSLLAELRMEQILLPLSNTKKVEKLLRFAVYIKEPKSVHPLAVLNVVDNTTEAEKEVAIAKKQLAGFLPEAAAMETEVNVMATIDNNKANGIARITREINADLIIIGWPQRKSLVFDKMKGDRTESILHHTAKTLFVCHFPTSVDHHKSLVLIVPPNAELELGFPIWLSKVYKLSTELNAVINLKCTERTLHAVRKFAKANKLSATLNHELFSNWGDILTPFRKLSGSDLVILVSARRGHISYNSHMSRLPAKLENYLPGFSRIIIYPQ